MVRDGESIENHILEFQTFASAIDRAHTHTLAHSAANEDLSRSAFEFRISDLSDAHAQIAVYLRYTI